MLGALLLYQPHEAYTDFRGILAWSCHEGILSRNWLSEKTGTLQVDQTSGVGYDRRHATEQEHHAPSETAVLRRNALALTLTESFFVTSCHISYD
jgi:hypothetical protein